jgi:hypothetical protein
MLREIRRGLLAIVAVVLGSQVSAQALPELANLSDIELKQWAYDLIDSREGARSLDPTGLVYAYGNDGREAKIGSAFEGSYADRNRDVIKAQENLGLTTDKRCLITGLTRGEAEFVERMTHIEYYREGRWLPPNGITHTSTEIFDAPDRNERCTRIQKNAEKAVAMRTPKETAIMANRPVTLRGPTLMTPFEVAEVARTEPANTNSAPTPKASPTPALVRGFEAVDKVVTLPERMAIEAGSVVVRKFAPAALVAAVGAIIAYIAGSTVVVALAPLLLVLTIVDYALLGWMVMPYLWSIATAIL